MCRYQQKFSESQGGRKEGHRIQYLPPLVLIVAIMTPGGRDQMSPETRGHPHGAGLWWLWWVAMMVLLQYCIVQCTCVMYRTVQPGSVCRRLSLWQHVRCEHTFTGNSEMWKLLFALFSFKKPFLFCTFKKPMGWKNCRACLNFMILLWCQSLYKILKSFWTTHDNFKWKISFIHWFLFVCILGIWTETDRVLVLTEYIPNVTQFQ